MCLKAQSSDTWVAWSCPHVPLQCKDTHKRLLSRLAEIKPKHVFLLGDLLEASPASRHPNEDKWTLDEEYESAAKYLMSIMAVCGPDAHYVWTLGNHDGNILAECRIDKRIRDMVDWSRHRLLGPVAAQWEQIPYSHRQVYRLGPITFRHGAEHGVNADRDQAVLFGTEHGLTVGGHTHRGFDVREAMLTSKIPLRKFFMNAGCHADWDKLGYMDRKSIAMWTHGLCVGDVSSAAVAQRKSRFSSPQWTARYEMWERGDGTSVTL